MYRLKKITPVAVSALAVASEIMPFINDKHNANGIVHAIYKLINKNNAPCIHSDKLLHSINVRDDLKLNIEIKIIDN